MYFCTKRGFLYMKKAWLKILATISTVFLAIVFTDTASATSKTAIEQTNYEDYYFAGAIICLVLAIFTFLFRAKKYKQQLKK